MFEAITMTKNTKMKQLSLSIATVAMAMFAASCGQPTSQGQLVGDYSNRTAYKAPAPVGMVFVNSGVMKSGYSDQDIANSLDAPARTLNMVGFYMDATEITNAEYRQFTNWVRDSMAHTTLGDFKDNEDGTQQIDWNNHVKWTDADVQDQLAGMYIDASQTGTGKKELDVTKLEYNVRYFDMQASIMNPGQPRSQFDVKKSVKIYPDTTVWMKQFAYSNNEPIARQYNWFSAFDEYPVVGVNWIQANAFCNWRTQLWKGARESKKLYFEGEFSLPDESQWEWAARGGRQLSPYPWGGPTIMNQKGCYLANLAQGGSLTIVPKEKLPDSLIPIISYINETLVTFVDRIFAIDFMFDEKQKPWIVELNSMPGLFFTPEEKLYMMEMYSELLTVFKNVINKKI